jgi:hypothetical protein
MIQIVLPLTSEQAKTVILAADAAGVEAWEMAAFVLQWKRDHSR